MWGGEATALRDLEAMMAPAVITDYDPDNTETNVVDLAAWVEHANAVID